MSLNKNRKCRWRRLFVAIGIYASLSALTSCTVLFKEVYGLKSFDKNATPEQQVSESRKFGVYQEGYMLDTNYSGQLLNGRWTSGALQHALLQPLQVRIYDRHGVLLDVVPNCNVPPGLSNLKWRATHVFDSLPDHRARMIDTTITLANDMSYLHRLANGSSATIHPEKEHTILVFWSYMMGRQSKRLVKLAKDARTRHRESYDLYFVVADNLYH